MIRASFRVLGASIFILAFFSSTVAASTGALRICQGCAAAGGDLSRYQYVVLHSDQASLIPTLKAKNPSIKALVYKQAVGTYSWAQSGGQDWTARPSGVGYVDATNNHPDWFLKDTAGNTIEFSDFPGMWLMDFGDPGYAQAWLQNVLADVKANGWDGVMIDDVNANQRSHVGSRTIAKYPTYADQKRAMTDFLKVVGPGLTSQGSLALPNIFVEWPEGPATWSEWIGYTSGAVQEFWTKWDTGTTQHFVDGDWAYRQGFLTSTQAAGKIYLGISYAPSSDLRSMRYARGSFLLDWNGGSGAILFEPGATDPWNKAWTIDIGTPTAPKIADNGAWKRSYSGGIVAVNPTSLSKTVSLGGTFTAADGTSVSSVTLAPATAAILRTGAPRPRPRPRRRPQPPLTSLRPRPPS
jgi:hypothetical protein